MWYPSRNNDDQLYEIDVLNKDDIAGRTAADPDKPDLEPRFGPCPRHSIFDKSVQFTHTNIWPKPSVVPKQMKERCRRKALYGVEVRDLPVGHVLAGQQGLFATRQFKQFDIIGEYTGEIVPPSTGGHYVACLEDRAHEDSLGLDAERVGNECRFINSYINIEFGPNVAMKTAYVDSYPHIIIIVIALTIEIGDEILLDYGNAYTNAFFTQIPGEVRDTTTSKNNNVSNDTDVDMLKALPFREREDCELSSGSDSGSD
jgi:hypothetical protein